jgi:hypothetical protein
MLNLLAKFDGIVKSSVMPRCGTVTETILLNYLKVAVDVIASVAKQSHRLKQLEIMRLLRRLDPTRPSGTT